MLPAVLISVVCGVVAAAERPGAMATPGDLPCPAVQGQLQQGGLAWGQVLPGAEVFLDSDPVPVLPDGRFVIAFSRDAAEDSMLKIEHDAGSCRQALRIAGREYRMQRVEGVPQRTVTPPAEQLERIRDEQARVRAAKERFIEDSRGIAQFLDNQVVWPASGPITGVYGSQRVYNGEPRSPHYGVDIAAPTGTPVFAPADGVITLAEPDLFFSGGTVILDHGYRLSSSFLHLSEVTVSVGDRIEQGDLLGRIGATGRATGPHLDWRMSWRDRRVDPQLLVPPMQAASPVAPAP